MSGFRGATWASFLSLVVPLPPWQSTHDSLTAAEICIGSMPLWQETQPSAGEDACGPAGGDAGAPRSGAKARAMSSRFIVTSERQDRVGEDVVERLAALVDVLESRSRLESRGAADDDDVLVEERPPAQAYRDVGAEGAVDGALEQQRLDWRGLVEADVVRGEDRLQSRREIDVDAGRGDLHAGVDVVRLPLILAAAKIGKKAAALDERNARAGEPQAEAVEER